MNVINKLFFTAFAMLLILTSCNVSEHYTAEWGSFSPDKTSSYDNKLYAIQTVEKIEDVNFVTVNVYLTETEELIYSFTPARALDFWGICWENDTYNIWIQSGDIGVFCYKYENDEWKVDKSATRPSYIKSKYDKYQDEIIGNTNN